MADAPLELVPPSVIHAMREAIAEFIEPYESELIAVAILAGSPARGLSLAVSGTEDHDPEQVHSMLVHALSAEGIDVTEATHG